jgi:hypothetical protein
MESLSGRRGGEQKKVGATPTCVGYEDCVMKPARVAPKFSQSNSQHQRSSSLMQPIQIFQLRLTRRRLTNPLAILQKRGVLKAHISAS